MPNSTFDKSTIFKTIAEEAIMGILVFDSDCNCLFANQSAKETIELDSEIPTKQISISSLAPETPKHNMKNFSEKTLNLTGLIRDVLMQKTNGTMFIADLGIKNATIDGKKIIILMLQDVTVQKKLQREVTAKQNEIHKAFEELLIQNKKLKELDLAKDRFMALTTHELRTPLSAIVATSEVLNMKLYDTDKQRDDFISTIYKQGTHLMTLVNDILDFTKIQAGKMDFFISEQNIFETLTPAVSQFQHIAESNKITLTYKASDQPIFCYIDSLRMSEVLTNVIGNAVKFCRKDHSVTITIKDSDEFVIISVADQGIGIKPENRDKIFNEFETVGNISTHQKGTGLGMPISKRIMEQLGGELYFTSQWEVGTEFFIKIPTQKILEKIENYRERPSDVDDLLATV